MKLKIQFHLSALVAMALVSCSTRSTSPTVVSGSADAYNRQQDIDNRLPQPLTTDPTSPLKDVRLKPGGVAINTATF